MKVCVLILLAALVACAYSAATETPCGGACSHADGGAQTLCENECTNCTGPHNHVHCNHKADQCECHVNDHTHPPHP